MAAEALKPREEIVLPVRSGKGGEIVMCIAGKDTCILLTQDPEGHLSQETIPLYAGADKIREFLAKLELTPEMKKSRELHGVPLQDNIITIARKDGQG